ncbi:MAG TPA: DEAD/DEAH box helicase, partial [Polyangiaceae bacterium]|nr:DEAD/DEAH box helicase [Polyangiaceae bacterium]
IDEAHRSLADSYLAVIRHYSDAGAVVLGMTATPYRADGGGLGDVYQALEAVASPRQLIAEGFLIEPRVFSAPVGARPDLTGVRTRGSDYAEADLAEAMNEQRLVGGIVEHGKRHAAGVRTVAFAVNVAHSLSIAASFVASGTAAEHLDGATPTRERDAILARLERGETLVVSNCGVLCEGWDMPCVKAAVLARPTKSAGLYLQQAGRILRPFDDTRAVILDHAGNALAHGLPQDDRDFSLDATQKRSGGGPTKTCPECDTVMPLGLACVPNAASSFAPANPRSLPPSMPMVSSWRSMPAQISGCARLGKSSAPNG